MLKTLLTLSLWSSSSSVFNIPSSMYDAKHGVKMGVSNVACDDAKTNLNVDWDGNPANHTCYWPTKPFWPDKSIEPTTSCVDLPNDYYPTHFCMKDKIAYKARIPTYGDHRPLWPKFGEYFYVPPQRWLHNIEHGSVVMLYHPCAHNLAVKRLKAVVRGCIRKHVITPFTGLTKERPLALVAWGCKMEMSTVDAKKVVQFIRARALKGPEGDVPKQGQFDEGLLELANVVPGSDENDSVLCPNFN